MNVVKFVAAKLSRESIPWSREVETRIQNLEADSARRENGETNGSKGRASTYSRLAEAIAAIPIPIGYFAKRTGFSLASPLTVDQTIVVPAGKTKVVFTAIGNVSVRDQTSGGVAVASAYIEASGSGFTWTSPIMPASKDAAASTVGNIITPALGFQQENLTPGSNFLVSLTVSASNPSAFPVVVGNFATLTITAIFFD